MPIENSLLMVNGDEIAYVGEMENINIPEDYDTIDTTGMTVIPGLIDTHVHFGGALNASDLSWILEHVIQKSIVAVAQAETCLNHGFTTTGDISRNGTYLRNMINEGIVKGPRIVTCGLGLSRTCGHGDTHGLPLDYVQKSHPWAICADGREELRKVVRSILRTEPDAIKIWATGGGVWRLDDKRHQHYSYEEIEVVVEEANYVGLPVRAHCESLEGARACIKAGVHSIEHGQELDEECLNMMVQKDISLVPTMKFFYEWFTEYEPPYRSILDIFPGETLAEKELNRTIANFQAAKDTGVRIAVGSDSFCSKLTPYGEYSLKEMYAVHDAGLSPMETIVAATKSGAEVLKVDDITGTLEKGKKADVVVLTKNPLEDITNINLDNMKFIIKGGKFVKR
ncbi:amidohydrolase family protein [Hathewaya histolytica]|uniref:Parathion hydrolase n=1 Tax=Hathewaya histolytica TaxID=1498 RepID=A0A4U9QX30_HATHI|nr:amidohydrolase family protein [Hathewaya histolytica]VTQ83265.1 parathion hydrolase [Hathewaya histolytica]